MKNLFFSLFILCSAKNIIAQQHKLPLPVFLQLIDSSNKIEINDATAFKHVDLPKKYFNTFISFIKDTVATPQPKLTTKVYYAFTLNNGNIINGDVYWDDKHSYILFKIDKHVYVNTFTREGIMQLEKMFKR